MEPSGRKAVEAAKDAGHGGTRRPLTRRALLTAVAGATGAGLAACAPSRPGLSHVAAGAAEVPSPAEVPSTGGTFANPATGADQRPLNNGIFALTSQLKPPPPFQVPLPVPATLTPRRTADTDYYDIVQTVARQEIIPGTKTTIWGYNGTFPGPTIVSTSGRRTVVTHHNRLPVPTVVHLHGGRTPPDQDGYATDFLLPAGAPTPSSFPSMPGMTMTDAQAKITRIKRDYDYPMQQRAATLWYHDHRMAFTGASVLRGLAGFHIIRDQEERALPLPAGDRDVPLMIADRSFAADGSFLYPANDPTEQTTPGVTGQNATGVMGDVVLVNGAPWPVMSVGTGRYRLRILNASNARTYQLALQAGAGANPSFTQIGTDGGLLAAPVAQAYLVVAPAQRFDVVVDFGGFAVGEEITMVNQADTGGPGNVMRFRVDHRINDTTSVPAVLSTVPVIDRATLTTHRTMAFAHGDGGWAINGHAFDPMTSEATVKNGDTEMWTITSNFHHPVHLHVANLQVLTRNGGPPGQFDHGWKDTVLLGPGDIVELAVRFDAYPGRYMFHCHNLEHEDMAMMANFHIAA